MTSTIVNVSTALGAIGALLGVTYTVMGTLALLRTPAFLGSLQVSIDNSSCLLSVGGGSVADANVPVQISAHGAQGYFGVNKDDGKPGLLMGYDVNSEGCTLRSVTDSLTFQVNNTRTSACTITPNGYTGFNTTTPGYSLDVGGGVQLQKNSIFHGRISQSEIVYATGNLSTSLDSILDGRNSSFTVSLLRGVDNQVKLTRLLTANSLPVTVSCVTSGGGSFVLSPAEPARLLHYTPSGWMSSSSFYPTIQQGKKLLASDAFTAFQCQQGSAVALSADGNVMAVGAQFNESVGGAWVYTRVGNTWSQQGKQLQTTGFHGYNSFFGFSAALSANGNILVLGSPGADFKNGAAWPFFQSGGTWSNTDKLVGTGAVGASYQGCALALSADGTTLAVGGNADNSSSGAVWMYTLSNSNWIPYSAGKIAGASGSAFGTSVALSSDGNTMAVGGPGDSGGMGACWIFVQTNGVWTNYQKLVGSNPGGSTPGQGNSVCLSSDGRLLAVGASKDNNNQGAEWLFCFSYGHWVQQGSGKLWLPGTNQFGSVVAFSSDGNTLAVANSPSSAPFDQKICYLFTRVKSNMVLQCSIGTSDSILNSQGIFSLALSANGGTLALGSQQDNNQIGAVWAFT